MVPTLSPSLVAMDILCCMGLGFFVAALRAPLPIGGQVGCFVADFTASVLVLLLAQAYAAQSSNAGVLRFYMVAALALGAFLFYKVIAPYSLFVVGVAQCIFVFPFRILSHKLVTPAFLWIKSWYIAQKSKRNALRAEKTTKKQLQTQALLLYNSNVDLYTLE